MGNFQATASINGLGTFALFTAPADGVYFVNGQLELPVPTGSGQSEVVTLVKKNGSTTLYTGIAGATGFQINQMALSAGDAITAALSSSAAVDNTLNAVRGVVSSGNTF